MSLKPSCILLRSSRCLVRRQQLISWCRSISTTSQCLRRRTSPDERLEAKLNNLKSRESVIAPEPRRQKLSDDDVQASLQQFLKVVNRRVENLLYTTVARTQTAGTTVTDIEFENLVLEFRDTIMANITDRMKDGNYKEAPPQIPTPEELFETYTHRGIRALDPLLLKYFKAYYFTHGHPSLKSVDRSKAIEAADLRNPGEWYPGARNMRRKIIMHVGPTNSGKTYQALRKLEAANTGWYGGPLRLLAHEVFNRMNAKGIKCNLRTGEEIRIVDPNAPLTSSTIEMFSETTTYDVAVIDEIQMLSDSQRGFAWTAALLGLKAKEIHLCGEEAAVPLVSEIAKQLGEEIEVNKYERLSPLKTAEKPLSTFRHIKAGDCVVAFSRSEIFNIKDQIENTCNVKCAVVYGGLPPESRSLQAALFNDLNSGYDVIVASDAIGMGLNLNIKRVIFATLAKNQAGTLIELFPSQIKQIAGRAGRFRVAGVSSDSTEAGGVVTAMHGGDMAILRKGMQAAMEPLSHAMLWPPWKVFEQFTHQFPVGTPLATMIGHFVDISKSTPIYRPIQSDQQMILAQAIEHLPNIDPESRYSITFAPISHKKEDEVRVFVRLAEVMSKCEPVTIKSPSLRLHLDLVDSQYKEVRPTLLRPLETLHKLITCYLWLSVRWPALYTDYHLAQDYKLRAEVLIHRALMQTKKSATRSQPPRRTEEQQSEGRQEAVVAA